MPKLSTVRYEDDYEELETLGRGTFGVVVKARHLIDNTVFVVEKVEIEPEQRVEEILREVKSHSAIEHPNIVACNASWIEEKIGSPGICLYLVTELGDETLEKWLEEHPNKEDRPKEGLKCIHENRMFHSDLTPRNIVLVHSPEGTVLKISVIGSVKAARDKDGAVTVSQTGTALYQAPELIEGEKKYNDTVDFYAMGLIFIEMVYPMNQEDRKTVFEGRQNDEEPEFLMPKDEDSDDIRLLKETLLGFTAIETNERWMAWFRLEASRDYLWNHHV